LGILKNRRNPNKNGPGNPRLEFPNFFLWRPKAKEGPPVGEIPSKTFNLVGLLIPGANSFPVFGFQPLGLRPVALKALFCLEGRLLGNQGWDPSTGPGNCCAKQAPNWRQINLTQGKKNFHPILLAQNPLGIGERV